MAPGACSATRRAGCQPAMQPIANRRFQRGACARPLWAKELNNMRRLQKGCVAPPGLGRIWRGSHGWRHGLDSFVPSALGDGRRRAQASTRSVKVSEGSRKVSEGQLRYRKVVFLWDKVGQGSATLSGCRSAGARVLLVFHTWGMQAASLRYSRLPVGATTEWMVLGITTRAQAQPGKTRWKCLWLS
ncbi:MAG: hypothetical protein JWR19_3799 [Pedosphaera sp.]|nr:hypothetical protein [Pedosphaera sp.]